MVSLQLWHRPWALLDTTNRRYHFLETIRSALHTQESGPIWLYTDAPGGPIVGGKQGIGAKEYALPDGHSVFCIPIPLRVADGLSVQTVVGPLHVGFASIPDRPPEDLLPENDEQSRAKALLDRIKSVWARLRDVELALADPASIWERLAALWMTDAAATNPEMDIIVRHARRLVRTIDLLDRAPRRILRRTHRLIPLARVQELDRRSMTWLVRQPGETIAERGGDRQRIQAVAREENFNTLENRVLLSYARLAHVIARDYRERHDVARHSSRVKTVAGYGVRCRKLEANFRDHGVLEASADVTPNFVLQNNPNYHKVWDAWHELLKRGRLLDELWRWQARSWDEFCCLAVVVALQSIPGARSLAVSPIIFEDEQRQGCWIRHLANPMAVFYLPEARVTVEVSYRQPWRATLAKFGAPIWLRLGRVDSPDFLLRWAIWPMWDASGGLKPGEPDELTRLVPNGRNEHVKGGIVLRPAMDGQDAEFESVPGAGCLTFGASGPALKNGLRNLQDFLRHTVLASAV
jgi:hypothetical protein